MITKISIHRFGLILVLAVAACMSLPHITQAADAKLEAVLVWGTNGSKPANSDLKPVTEGIAKKLNSLPFKYTNYFEVNRAQFELKNRRTAKVTMSAECKITVRSLEGDKVELTLIGRGQQVGKITQALKRGKCLVTGGNAENSTAWFVVVRQIDR